MNKNASGFTVCPRRNRHGSPNAFGGLLLSLLLMQASAWAQSTTAVLFGTVHDPSGAPVPTTIVKVTNRQTGLVRSAITDSDGNYDFSLPRGLYDISASHPGFKTEVREGVALSTEDRVHLDVGLTVGEVTESVTVNATVSPVNTGSGELSRVVTGTEVEALPLNNRKLFWFSVKLRPPSDRIGEIPPFGRGFSRHKDLSVRCVFFLVFVGDADRASPLIV